MLRILLIFLLFVECLFYVVKLHIHNQTNINNILIVIKNKILDVFKSGKIYYTFNRSMLLQLKR